MKRFFGSAKAMTLLLDAVISILLTGMAIFLEPQYPDVVKFVTFTIGALQPVFIALIAAIAGEDIAAKRANGGKLPGH